MQTNNTHSINGQNVIMRCSHSELCVVMKLMVCNLPADFNKAFEWIKTSSCLWSVKITTHKADCNATETTLSMRLPLLSTTPADA